MITNIQMAEYTNWYPLEVIKEHERFEIKVCPGTLADTPVAVMFICTLCNKMIPISAQNKSGALFV